MADVGFDVDIDETYKSGSSNFFTDFVFIITSIFVVIFLAGFIVFTALVSGVVGAYRWFRRELFGSKM